MKSSGRIKSAIETLLSFMALADGNPLETLDLVADPDNNFVLNPWKVDPMKIADIEVLETIKEGTTVDEYAGQ